MICGRRVFSAFRLLHTLHSSRKTQPEHNPLITWRRWGATSRWQRRPGGPVWAPRPLLGNRDDRYQKRLLTKWLLKQMRSNVFLEVTALQKNTELVQVTQTVPPAA